MLPKVNKFTVVTCSKKKIAEIRGIFGPECNIEIDCRSIDLHEYQGESEFIVRQKCIEAAKIINGPVLVEDTNVRFNALNGLPGPYIKWFDETIGATGMYRILKDYEDKSAIAISMLAFTEGINKPVHVFEGCCSGRIVEPVANGNYTWTACFIPDGQDKVYDDLGLDVKNQISERFYSVNKLKKFLLGN